MKEIIRTAKILFVTVGSFSFYTGIAQKNNVNKTPSEFNVELQVEATTIEKNFDTDGGIESRRESKTNYNVNQVLNFNDVLYQRIADQIQNLDFCKSKGMCVLFTGNNQVPEGLAKKIHQENCLIEQSSSTSSWSKCDGSLVLTSQKEGSGNIEDNVITTQIVVLKSAYKQKALPLFQLFVTVGHFMHNTTGPKLTGKNYDCDAKKWVNDSDEDHKYGMNVPSFTVLEDLQSNNTDSSIIRSFEFPLFDESDFKDFLQNLRNNKFSRAFNLNAREYFKDVYREEQTDIKITLIFKGTWQPSDN